MNKILIPMTDYVLEKANDPMIIASDVQHQIVVEYYSLVDYASFLKQPLKLEMFIPCDDDGNVLEPVIQMDYIHQIEGYAPKHPQECYEHDLAIYKKALSKVIFKVGFENNNSYFFRNPNGTGTIEYNPNTKRFYFGLKTIENLTHLNLELK
jgi:hypothetical protein